jgi:hypothetical protein
MNRPDISRGEHLPNLREDRKPPHPSWLPRQRRGTTPQMIGRYPDFNVFDARPSWDAATAAVIDDRMRVRKGGPTRFFSPEEALSGRAFCDSVTAQDEEPRIPVIELIDRTLAEGKLDGYQYAGMPDDRDTWRTVLSGLDHEAGDRFGAEGLGHCSAEEVEDVVLQFADGNLRGTPWDPPRVKLAWKVCSRMIASAFYSHPWSWNEIGFGGPAYPRGYMRLGPVGVREPFEKPGATDEDPVEVVEKGEV